MKYDVKLIKQLLLDFYSNQENVKLVDYYTSQTFFDAIKKSRSETVHSAFLAWLLEGKDFPNQGNNSTLMHFLQILLRRYEGITNEMDPQEKAEFDTSLSDALYSGTLTLSNIKVETEKPVNCFYQSADNKDKIDIFITCQTNLPNDIANGYKTLNIFIENKIGSDENRPIESRGIKKEIEEEIERYNQIKLNYEKQKEECETEEERQNIEREHYKQLYQTDKYYFACHSEDKNSIDLFVFLTAISQKQLDDFNHQKRGENLCWCEKYIHICYKDLLDYVILPQLEMPNIPESTQIWLKEYVKCLSIPAATVDEEGRISNDDKQIILAVSDSEHKRVKEFSADKRNKALLYALISLYATRDYYSVGGNGLYSFKDALITVFEDYEGETIQIKKREGGNHFTLIGSKKDHNNKIAIKQLIEIRNGIVYLNPNCETDYAIEQINEKLDKCHKIEKISVSDKAKELLEPFWDRNQALILSVLHILSESETTYAYIYEDFSSRDNTKFIIGQEECSKIDVVEKFVQHIWSSLKSIDKINDYLKEISTGPGRKGVLITTKAWDELREKEEGNDDKKKRPTSDRFKRIKLDSEDYYLSTQWGGRYNSTKKKLENFPMLWKKIMEWNEKNKTQIFDVRPK